MSRAGGDTLKLRYTIRGGLEEIVWPPVASPVRADGLWRHTCFEAFIASASGEGYFEFNFSPSRAWAAYAFDGYRSGMRLALVSAPTIEVIPDTDGSILDVWAPLPESTGSRLALSAVIEHIDGDRSYWALAHAPGKPDFHHADGFVAMLPSPENP